MNDLHAFDARLHDLLAALCDGTLDAVGSAELESLVLSDPRAAEFYVKYLHLHVAISRYSLIANVPQDCESHPPQDRESQATSETSPAVAGAEVASAPDVGSASSVVRATIARAKFAVSRPIVWSVLAAGILFAGYVAVISWNMLSRDRLTAGNDSGEVVATIRETSDVEWSKDDQSPLAPDQAPNGYPGAGGEGSAIVQNQPLSITSGLIELQLTSGTTLIIEGPADWKINGENSATLTHGKLVARVPQQAIGFTLETPSAKIVDLGTEFGVVVDNSGGTEVHVLRGTVESTTRKSNSSAPPKPIRLITGEALRIDSSESARRIAVEESKFKLSTLSIAAPTTIRTYSEAIVADRPLAYWPLDEAVGATSINDRSGNDHTGTVKGVLEFGVAGPVRNPTSTAARFDGASWIEIAKPEPLALSDDFTVEAWLRPESTNDIGRAVSVDPGNNDHGWGFGWLPQRRMANDKDGILFTLYGVKDYRLDRQPWPTDQSWHHVAIICDRNRHAYLFVDGKWSAMVEGQKSGIKGSVQATIGRQSNGSQSYRGGMAHLAIYPRALDERQILRHFKFAAALSKDGPLTDTNQKR